MQEQTGVLIVEDGSLKGERFNLPSPVGALLLGREADCQVRFNPNAERMVGRHHAIVEVRSDGVFVTDRSSANKTWWSDGAPLEPGVARRLQNGDRFQLGGQGGPWIRVELPPVTPPTLVWDPRATVVSIQGPGPGPGPDPGHGGVPRQPVSQTAQRPVVPAPAVVTQRPDREAPQGPRPFDGEATVPPMSATLVKPPPMRAIREAGQGREGPAPQEIPSQDRAMLLRQVVVIALLLSVAGLTGALFGLYGPGSSSSTAADRSSQSS